MGAEAAVIFFNLRQSVATHTCWRYRAPVAVNPVAGFGDPISKRRTSAHHPIAGAFFASAMSCHGGCAWETERSAGFRLPRFANLRTVASNDRLATVGGGSNQANGAVPMKHDPALNPSALRERATAHRAMAVAALRTDSSLANRLRRYNHHMTIARELEASAERLGATCSHDPRPVQGWLKAGNPVRIDALNLRDHLSHVHGRDALESQGGAQ